MSVRIIIDSTTDLIPALRDRVKVIPLSIRFGEEEYIDGVTINTKEFYEKLVSGDVLPTTSQPTPAAFGEAYEEAVSAGDSVIVITIASKLSGTYQSATIAAEDYPGKVFVVDSRNVAIGATILVQHALELADQGLSAEEIFERLLKIRSRIRIAVVVDTLEYLHKGGRISKTVAIAGGLLSIKPVIIVENGELKMVNKARGNKQANAAMNKEIDKAGGVDFSMPVLLGYTGTTDELLRKYIAESAEYWGGRTFPSTIVGSTVGTHAGPNAVAVAFYVQE
ncbi:MAG: DegV family protein [Oscillospiraceae bacterium]|nr:DegV family protein [Oscillospiraceae bacterium]